MIHTLPGCKTQLDFLAHQGKKCNKFLVTGYSTSLITCCSHCNLMTSLNENNQWNVSQHMCFFCIFYVDDCLKILGNLSRMLWYHSFMHNIQYTKKFIKIIFMFIILLVDKVKMMRVILEYLWDYDYFHMEGRLKEQ